MTDGGRGGRVRNWTASFPPSTLGISLLIGSSYPGGLYFRSLRLRFKGLLARVGVDLLLARGSVWLSLGWYFPCRHRLPVPSSQSPNLINSTRVASECSSQAVSDHYFPG